MLAVRAITFGILVTIAAVAAPAHAQTLTAAEIGKVDTIVTGALAKSGVPSASIAIVRGGKIVFAKAFGKQSESIAIARADAPYQIASISKQFTAAALLILENRGRLSLDDKVAKWVPGITGGELITIRQLLSHTSGLQDYWPQDYILPLMTTPTTPQAIVDRWAKKPLDFEPGTQWQYSNTGYVVAGMIVEKAAGKPLLAFLQGEIFKPLAMKVIDQDLAVGPAYPAGYHRFALGPVRVAKPAATGWLFAAGELAMSASDLAKWDIARMNRSLLPAEDWQSQEATVKLASGEATGYGLGVKTGTANGHRFVEHTGEADGFLSENIVFPEDKVAVVVLVNADFSDAFTSIASQIFPMILPAQQASSGPQLEVAKTAQARATFDQLRAGALDRSKLTGNSNYYFDAVALSDYRTSLGKLGDPATFELSHPPRLRGGFVNRNYTVTYGDGRKLLVVTYAELGAAGRYEQFLVMPAQ